MGPVSLARLVCGGERQVSAVTATKWRAWVEAGRPGGHGPWMAGFDGPGGYDAGTLEPWRPDGGGGNGGEGGGGEGGGGGGGGGASEPETMEPEAEHDEAVERAEERGREEAAAEQGADGNGGGGGSGGGSGDGGNESDELEGQQRQPE